ncbi:MAG: CinA family protein [Methanomassiliicoccales archaeon]|nr:CinA family protein [Methanomassiliicoccales archaeon]
MLGTEVLDKLRKGGLTIAVAESCTGGRICDLLTNVPGCSDVFRGGVVVYSDDSKKNLLGVSQVTIREHGAVSPECVKEMVEGVVRIFNADIGVAVSGIAGPSGGTEDKPVGLVYVALSYQEERIFFKMEFEGSRESIKEQAANESLQLAFDFIP